MMKKLLFILFVSVALNISAQTTETVTINWSFGSNPSAEGDANANRTIEVGDTVDWYFYSTGSHNVVSDGSATESFSSGALMGNDFTFSHTFTTVGSNPFVCEPHSGSMFGTITVVAEGALNLNGQDAPTKFSIYPNPSSDLLNISLPRLSDQSLNLEVFDVLGKRVYTQQLGAIKTKVNISKWNSGVYLVRLTSADDAITLTKRFVKL
ncbi:T9SS type A sorting domain-containing protein [Sediminibacter sp. Hel_I_10]|uniref:T9SS type A sorting domain-containing protein n=1 Tax=Sediminibacter sp. Hel_I_10 TaxID=1392490 RepID=UPI000A62C463|nr:T9SS type A sorting domain-containing protein [Sediminibacter sp. Hel_I_10]